MSATTTDLISDETAMTGCNRQQINIAWNTLVAAANRHDYGGAVAIATVGNRIVLHRATGWAIREPAAQRIPMANDTIFDLASLTKVTATTPSILRLISEGTIGLDQPLGEIIEEFGTDGLKAEVTIRRLLTHSAGFRDWIPHFLEAHGADAYLRKFAGTQPEWQPGTKIVYSDPSFITLGEVVHRVTGDSVATYARREILVPLGMIDTGYLPLPQIRYRVAGTELSNEFERDKVPDQKPANGEWRTGLIHGQVHDGNAWYGFDGVAGHAGLFGTAIDLARYGQAWLTNTVPGISSKLLDLAKTEQSGITNSSERRGLGWRLTATRNNEPEDSGLGFGPNAFGHTGFTGTSLWIDPDRDLVVVLLTNRVHPTVKSDYQTIRASFNAAIVSAVR
ncbi:MAG: serine hydrolase domain-containing protein [Thermomicrobiales bacterium]